jgi:hypothetical protein
MFLDANVETLLSSHAKTSTESGVSKGLNDLVNGLLTFSSEGENAEELRDQYLRDMSRAYRSRYGMTDRTWSFVADIMPFDKLKWYTLQKLDSMRAVKEEKRQNAVSTLLAAAAAAVGNADAVACYLPLGGNVFERLESFSTPLATAASTGKSEISLTLLGEATQDVLTVSTHTPTIDVVPTARITGSSWLSLTRHAMLLIGVRLRQQ